MAQVYRPSFTVVDPKTGRKVKRKSKTWHIRYYTPDGQRIHRKGHKDKKATEALAVELEKQAEREAEGLADPTDEQARRPLEEHLENYRRYQAAKENTAGHVEGVCSWYLGGKFRSNRGTVERGGNPLRFFTMEFAMAKFSSPSVELSREERIEAILKQLRPKIDGEVRRLVERAVDVPEAEEFGAIDLEFRDAGLDMANDIRQASVASRKKRGT